MTRRVLVPALALTAALASSLSVATPARAQESAPEPTKSKMKTDAEWMKILTPDQFLVTRRKATEPAFSGKYANNHAKGVYDCVCCGTALFSSTNKFESGTGWPSFWRPIDPKRIANAQDHEMGVPRVEVMCRECGAHLGHVFDDGPPPTGLRFCINSLSLKFVPATAAGAASSKKGATDKAKSRNSARAKGTRTPTPPAEDTPAPARESKDTKADEARAPKSDK